MEYAHNSLAKGNCTCSVTIACVMELEWNWLLPHTCNKPPTSTLGTCSCMKITCSSGSAESCDKCYITLLHNKPDSRTFFVKIA